MAARELTADEKDMCDQLFEAWFRRATSSVCIPYGDTWDKMYRAWLALFRVWATTQGSGPLPAYQNFVQALEEVLGQSLRGVL